MALLFIKYQSHFKYANSSELWNSISISLRTKFMLDLKGKKFIFKINNSRSIVPIIYPCVYLSTRKLWSNLEIRG